VVENRPIKAGQVGGSRWHEKWRRQRVAETIERGTKAAPRAQ